MKAIQITMDEELLEALDRTAEVRAEGRSAVLRRAVAEYLERRHRSEIAERYARGYGSGAGMGDEFEGWAEQATWPGK